MTVIDFHTRQEAPNRIAELEQENAFLRGQLQYMQSASPRRKHPLSVVLGIWFIAGFYMMETAIRIYSLMAK